MQADAGAQTFDLPVVYKGEEISLPAKLLRFGYSYRIVVTVAEQELIFEPDEERNFRALLAEPQEVRKTIPGELIKAVIEALEKHLR